MKFNQLYKLLIEGYSQTYKFEEDNKQYQMMDFYILQAITHDWEAYGGSETKDSDVAKDITELLSDIKKEMIPKLKNLLLEAVSS